MELADLVQEDVVTVSLEDSILDVAEVFRTEGVGSAVVVNPDGEPFGIVTDRDLAVYGQNFADSLERTPVNEILSMSMFSVEPDVSVPELTARMREESVRRVPVVDDGDLVGIVTLDDIVVGLADELDSQPLRDLAAVIEAESPRRPENATDGD
ncbi:MAG: CBS domain-containing protein [Haloarculaceae archaeon]